MKKIAVAVIITVMVLGAVYGSAAAISIGGVDKLKGDSSETVFTDTTGIGKVDTCTMADIASASCIVD